MLEKRASPVQVRLPEPLEDAVRLSAERNGRTVTAEIKALIERGLKAQGPDSALYGETPEIAAYNQALGQLVALLRYPIGLMNDEYTPAGWNPSSFTNEALVFAVIDLLKKLPTDAPLIGDSPTAPPGHVGQLAADALFRQLQSAASETSAAAIDLLPRTAALASIATALRIRKEKPE